MSSLWPSPEDYARIERDEPDANYLKLLKRLTNLFDRAMGEELISAATRDRVINRVLCGTPTPAPDEPRDWAEPEPGDLAVIEALADAAPASVRTRPTWDVPPVNG